jgi:hypothetical protein
MDSIRARRAFDARTVEHRGRQLRDSIFNISPLTM